MIHDSWKDFLFPLFETTEVKRIKHYVQKMRKENVVYPGPDDIFNAFNFDYNDINIVILGQDPYHDGSAHGLAFSSLKGVPPSLQNIFKELRSDLYAYMDNNTFKKFFPNGNLTKWSKQGILLLNTALTVIKGMPGSQTELWKPFTEMVLEKLREHPNNIVYMLWGKKAYEYRKFIDETKDYVITTSHPSPYSATETNVPFISSRCFSRAISWLKENSENFNNKKKNYIDLNNIIDIDEIINFIKQKFKENGYPYPDSMEHIEKLKNYLIDDYKMTVYSQINFTLI